MKDNIHPDFDGHIEFTLKNKSPAEKIEYLWEMILLNRFLKTAVKKERRGLTYTDIT